MFARATWGRAIALVGAATSACALVIGEIPEGSDPAAAGGTGSTTDGAASDGSTGEAGPDSSTLDAELEGSSGSAGAPDGSDAPGCLPCDCDDDKQASMVAGCGGTDCDDLDANVFAGQTKFFAVPRANGSFDYDCDGLETPDLAKANCAGALCLTNVPGTLSDPVCGAENTWATCAPATLSCSVAPTTTKVFVKCR